MYFEDRDWRGALLARGDKNRGLAFVTIFFCELTETLCFMLGFFLWPQTHLSEGVVFIFCQMLGISVPASYRCCANYSHGARTGGEMLCF